MTQQIQRAQQAAAAIESQLDDTTLAALVLNGDLARLTEQQRVAYYIHRARAAGLDPGTKPFDLILLNGKLTLYATKECSAQLTASRNLSIRVTDRQVVDGVYVVTAQVEGDGRVTEDIGAVQFGGLKGDAAANALMKATTKAKRRAVLSHCGLGMVDETELETIPGAARVEIAAPQTKPE